MSLSDVLIKLGGIILFVVGLALILSIVGVNIFGVNPPNVWVAIIVGVLFIAAGIILIKGGSITL